MTFSLRHYSLILFSFLFFCNTLYAKNVTPLFSIDTDHKLKPHFAIEKNGQQEFTFTNQEGQTVNGVFLKPLQQTKHIKFALALHPMGDSHSFWWREKSNLDAYKLSRQLRHLGFTVVALDARLHGKRSIEGFGPRALLQNAHSDEPSKYNDTIGGSVRDYRLLLHWIQGEHTPQKIIALGYSMGAQMSLLLARYEPSISAVLAMVPPFVDRPDSPVAPRAHTPHIVNPKVLWLAANKDQFSEKKDIQDTFDSIISTNKEIQWFDSGHRLPLNFIEHGLDFINSLEAD